MSPVDFVAAPTDVWTMASGGNVRIRLMIETNDGKRVLGMVFERRNPADDSASANYFGIRRLLSDVPSGMDGIRITLSSSEEQSVYLGLSVLSGQWWKTYGSAPFQPSQLSPKPTSFYFPLAQLKSGENLFNPNVDRIAGFAFSGRAPIGTVRIHELTFCRAERERGGADAWVKAVARTSSPCAIFERGAPLVFGLTLGARPGLDDDGLVYAVRDGGKDTVVARGALAVGTNTVFDLSLPSLPTGYYELTLFPARSGRPTTDVSCLKSAGSAPAGVLPFAVMPATMEENIARIRRVGEDDAFFGIHNMRFQYKLHELMAFPWCLRNARWNEYESAEPVRGADGLAPWAAKKLAAEPPQPDYLFSCTSFNPNHVEQIPAWALTGSGQTPGFRWTQYGPFAADQLRVTGHLYPHQKHHLVEGAWEIHLNRPPYTQKPVYTDDAIIELFRAFRPVVRAADPGAVFVGAGLPPEADLIGKLADAGFLEQVDGLAFHSYGDPEALVGRLTAVRAALAARGKASLPLYDTECGFTSKVGGVQRLVEQAAKLVRQNLVLKGEGVIAHLTFYPFDYGREGEGTYGICFSLDDRMGFGPVALAPKPAVPALAVCAHELLGARPAGRIQGWADTLYGYCFLRDGEPVLALWTPAADPITLRVPAGDRDHVRVTGFMGQETSCQVSAGVAGIEVSDTPVYVSGLMTELYTAPQTGGNVRLYPGQCATVALPEGCATGQSWGVSCAVNAAARQARVAVPVACSSGPQPILWRGKNGRVVGVTWLTVLSAVEVGGCRPLQNGSQLALQLGLINHGAQAAAVTVRTSVTGSGSWSSPQKVTLAAGATVNVRLPLGERAETLDAKDALPVSIVTASDTGDTLRLNRRLTFLTARRVGASEPLTAPESDQVCLEGTGSSGSQERAAFVFSWDTRGLRLSVVRHDDVQSQPYDGGDLWRGDSLQLAFDTDPDSDRPYDPLVYAVSKKVTEVTVSRTASGCKVWRQRTHNVNELPLGYASNWQVAWDRDETEKVTRIRIEIPWSEIGLTAAPAAGSQIGIAAVVNDLDGEKQVRKTLTLFGGIDSVTKSYNEFGRLTLR